jgi:hypothetical protein
MRVSQDERSEAVKSRQEPSKAAIEKAVIGDQESGRTAIKSRHQELCAECE